MQGKRQGQAIESTGVRASQSHNFFREFAKFVKACRPMGEVRPSDSKGKAGGRITSGSSADWDEGREGPAVPMRVIGKRAVWRVISGGKD